VQLQRDPDQPRQPDAGHPQYGRLLPVHLQGRPAAPRGRGYAHWFLAR